MQPGHGLDGLDKFICTHIRGRTYNPWVSLKVSIRKLRCISCAFIYAGGVSGEVIIMGCRIYK